MAQGWPSSPSHLLPAGWARQALLTQGPGGWGSGECWEGALDWEACSVSLANYLTLPGLGFLR